MLINTGTEKVPSKNGLLTTVCYKIGDQATVYALEGSIAVTGSLVQWLRDNLGLIGSAPEIETLAKTVEDNGGAYFVPAFSGLFAPYWRGDARGAIVGLTRFVNKGHIARAALEATAFQSKEVLDAMNADSGVDLTALKVDGGMVANETLMQFQADILGVPVIRPVVAETTALGAAYAAGLAVGFWAGRGRHPRELGRGQALGAEHGRRAPREALPQVEEGRHQDLRLGRRGRLSRRGIGGPGDPRPAGATGIAAVPRPRPRAGPAAVVRRTRAPPRRRNGVVLHPTGMITGLGVGGAALLVVIPAGGPDPEGEVQSDRVGLSAQDLLSAFENAPIGMAVLTPAGVITACNTAMGRLLERDAADLIGGTFFDVTHVDDLDEARRKCALIQVEGGADRAPRVPVRAARRTDHLGVDQHVPGAADPGAVRAPDHAHRGRQRPQAAGGRTQPPGPARPAHRPGEPDAARRADAGGPGPPRPPLPGRAPVLPRPRRVQDGERPVRARSGRRGAHPARAADRSRCCGPATSRPGSGATSSPSCATTPSPQHARLHRGTAADGGGGAVRRRRLDDQALGGRGVLRDRRHRPGSAAAGGRPADVRRQAPARAVRPRPPDAVPRDASTRPARSGTGPCPFAASSARCGRSTIAG